MNKLVPILSFFLFILIGCQDKNVYSISSDGAITFKESVIEGVDVKSIVYGKSELLPALESIVSKEIIGEALGTPGDGLLVKPSGGRDNNRTCFFKYEDFTYPNAGILLQAMKNPIPEDYPEYVIGFIDQKIHMGEKDMNPDIDAVYYKKIEGLGDSGAYSTDLGKYYWRLSDKVLFHIAFNSPHTPDEQIAAAMKIGKAMTESYLNLN